MRVAVLNNYPLGRGRRALKRIKHSLKLLGATPVVVDPPEALNGGFDAYILTGTSPPKGRPLPRLGVEVYLIKKLEAPILGICFGLHLIAQSCGARLAKMPFRRVGFKELRTRLPSPLFEGLNGALVWENHKVRVVDEGLERTSLELLAYSLDNPVEAVQVKGRKVFGVQFHPERHDEARRGGLEVLRNFLSLA